MNTASIHTHPTKTINENFTKTLFRVERFENAVFACTYGQKKTELFENAEVTRSANLFRGLIIANTYASNMRSRVSYRFQINSSYTSGHAKTLRADA